MKGVYKLSQNTFLRKVDLKLIEKKRFERLLDKDRALFYLLEILHIMVNLFGAMFVSKGYSQDGGRLFPGLPVEKPAGTLGRGATCVAR